MALKLPDFVRPYLEGVTAVRGVLPAGLTVAQLLPLPDGVREEDAHADASAAVLTVVAVEKELAVGDLTMQLGALNDNAFAVLLLGWEPSEMPWHRLIDAVGSSGCQLLDVEPLRDRRFPMVAAVVHGGPLRTPRPYLLGGQHAPAPVPGDVDAERRLGRRAITELLVTTAEQRRLRAVLADRAADEPTGRADLEAELRRTRQQLRALERSTTVRLGRAVAGARRPSGLAALPRELVRIARLGRRRRAQG